MDQELEYGDDLFDGFSDPSDCEHEHLSGEEGCEDSLDLLSSMLDTTDQQEQQQHKDSRVRSNQRVIQQKRVHKNVLAMQSKNISDEKLESSVSQEMAAMKSKMEKMQAELTQLRQQAAKQQYPKQLPPRQHPAKTNGLASSVNQTSTNNNQTKPSVVGERKRTAYQQSTAAPQNRGIVVKENPLPDGVHTERYSGIRIKNPLVSSEVMSGRMSGRKMIRLPRLVAKTMGNSVEGDWVTIGVIVDKLPPKESKKGDKYSVWKLSDLSSLSSIVTVFLFGQAYRDHWKTPLGNVVALLNPNIMPDNKEGSGSVALSLDHPKKLMLMGVSQDFTLCKATTKNGRQCTNFASAAAGGRCDYHIQSAYSKSRSNRMELQTGYGPSSSRLHDKLFKGSKTDMYFAGGKTFVASRSKAGSSDNERLFVPGAKKCAAEAMAELKEKRGGVSCKKGVVTQEGSEIFKQMLQQQSSIGARMLNKHIQKEEVVKQKGQTKRDKSALELLRDETEARKVNSTVRVSPVLGRGMSSSSILELGGESSKVTNAKKRALALVKASESKKKSNVLQKVAESRELTDSDPPASKKQRLSDGEIDRILNAKSSHDWINEEAELEKEQEYFDRLEKKENIELQQQNVKELRVSVVQCKQCNYTAEYPSALCKKEGHVLSKFKVMKRCYECRGCRERQFVYSGRCPVVGCRRCGGTLHDQVSLYRERKGPTLPTEELKLRGDEEKFLR